MTRDSILQRSKQRDRSGRYQLGDCQGSDDGGHQTKVLGSGELRPVGVCRHQAEGSGDLARESLGSAERRRARSLQEDRRTPGDAAGDSGEDRGDDREERGDQPRQGGQPRGRGLDPMHRQACGRSVAADGGDGPEWEEDRTLDARHPIRPRPQAMDPQQVEQGGAVLRLGQRFQVHVGRPRPPGPGASEPEERCGRWRGRPRASLRQRRRRFRLG
ncbi:hypothetical protein T484DRAFT_2112126 [Baffinella frigidus]|nr:hypothetical protein T484DRAFT_2112126 [Cryptophyta sp. CCMP2293]